MRAAKSRIVFFLAGLGVFIYLISRFGVDRILANIERAGWSLILVIGVWFFIYLLNTLSWKLVLGSQGHAISFRRLFMVTVSGFVINYITPVVAIGGEPYKVRMLAGTLGPEHSVSAVVLYRMVHLLGHMLLLLGGIVLALAVLPLPAAMEFPLILAGAVVLGVILLTFSGHRGGVFRRIQRIAQRIPFLRGIPRILERDEEKLAGMDRLITGVYHDERGRFLLAVFSEFVTRLLMGVEVYLILQGIGVGTSLTSALFLYVSYSIIINLLFFVPMALGTREGGLALGLGSLALPPLLGVYLGVVMRIREFVWILLGLLFILLTKEKEGAAAEG